MTHQKKGQKKPPASRVALTAFQLRAFRQQYREYRDPFLPWLAWRWARAGGTRLPSWAQTYFDRVALALEALGEGPSAERLADVRPYRTPDALASALARALEMKSDGAGSVYGRRAAYRRDVHLARRVQRLVEDGHQVYLAVELVAKDGAECRKAGFPELVKKVSPATVNRAYSMHVKARRP